MVRLGSEVRSWMDYTLGMDHRLFSNVYVQDPSHNFYYYLILWCLCSSTLR